MDDRADKSREPVQNVNEEMASDFAYGLPMAHDVDIRDTHLERVNASEGSGALGWVALVFAIASWFVWPLLIGASAAVLGYVAFRQGARGLGGWAIAMGLFAVLLHVIVVPFYYALT
ncbi:hypothetical protein [Paenibacillus sp. HB172176]|uniref:hypothetical protein n=1 Tax=Paenibacillus sp. HB172176 TaxID=2493690 RepID=UPI00143B0653|nr:hypothetical protein [Paenibacillus sp. HB172176]